MAASVRLHGIPAGILTVERDGALSFEYLPEWIDAAHSPTRPTYVHPLSVQLPIRPGIFGGEHAGPYFDGLLPDSRAIRKRLAAYFDVDASDDYGLLTSLGRECPGAVSVVPLDVPFALEEELAPAYDQVAEGELAALIRGLPNRPLFVDGDGEIRLSLAGVHDKAAVLVVDGQVALARGQTPTSHILKVDILSLPDSIRVEHFCLQVAKTLGLDTPRSSIRVAEDQVYMLVARYDRAIVVKQQQRFLRRLHQEDFCQALGRYPAEKYEKDGGPGWRECFQLMDMTADPLASRSELLSRAIFQFLIGNPDAHAKNYSLVYRDDRLALSKLYDVNNAAAFKAHYKAQRARLAMFVGGNRNPDQLTDENWRQFSSEVGIRRELVRDRLATMAIQLPQVCEQVREASKGTVADSALLDLVVQDVGARCRKALN